MTETPGTRLRAARELMGFKTAKDAALDMGVAIATYTMHEKASSAYLPREWRARSTPPISTRRPNGCLYGRAQDETRTIPFLAIDGQHSHFMTPAIDGGSCLLRAVAIPPEDTISPLLAGWTAYFEKPQGQLTRDTDGQLCVIRLASTPRGDLMLRVQAPDLDENPKACSTSAASEPQPTLFDQPVEWAARVISMSPGGQPGNMHQS